MNNISRYQIIAFKCPDTGQLFESKNMFDKHRSGILKQKKKRLSEIARIEELNRKFSELYDQKTFKDVEEWVKNNSTLFGRKVKFVEFELTGMRYGDISNTHSAPIGKKTNWGRYEKLPISYKGWKGKLKFQTEHRDGFELNRALENRGICTGTGSGVGTYYRCDVILWEDDFHALKKQHDIDQMKQKLGKKC